MGSAVLRLLAGTFCCFTLLLPGSARAGALSRDLAAALSRRPAGAPGGPESPLRVVVQPAPGKKARVLQRLQAGGHSFEAFTGVDAAVAALSPAAIRALAEDPDVGLVAPDREVRGLLDTATVAVGAAAAREATGLTGAGVGVAVLDTGVDEVRDLRGRVAGWADFVKGRKHPYDDNGHGTHVAGIIAGDGTAAARFGRDLRGAAPGAHLIGVKVLDENAVGRLSAVLAGLDWVITNRDRFNIRIVNLSLGLPVQEGYGDDPLCQAVGKVWQAGILVVASAGNNGRLDSTDPFSGPQYGTITSPGNHPLVLTVGATRTNGTPDPSDDEVASYSSRGPTLHDYVVKPDLVAPGNRVVSLLAQGNSTLSRRFPDNVVRVGGGRYLELSGTSMAAPLVAGSAALMLQADPTLTPDTVKVRMILSARQEWNPSSPETAYSRGAGLLDVTGALTSGAVASSPAFSPTVRPGELPADMQLTTDAMPTELMIWGDTTPWGDPDDAQVWSLMLLWQSASTGASRPNAIMIWGDAVLYPD